MSCYLCAGNDVEQFHDRCRDSAETPVFRCKGCGLLFLGSVKTSEQFYEASGMYEFEKPDRAELMRDEEPDTRRRAALLEPLVRGKRWLDFGCGTGATLLRLRRSCDAAGVELNEAHRKALLAEGVPVYRTLGETQGSFAVISLFHVLEHLPDPIAELRRLRERLAPGGALLVEVPNAGDALLSIYGSRAFMDFTFWTPHLYTFSPSTLREIFRRAGFGSVELRFEQRYPIANHLRWLAEGKPGGHQAWERLGSPELDAAYAKKLAQLEASDTLIATARA